jgi:hypothetical protein
MDLHANFATRCARELLTPHQQNEARKRVEGWRAAAQRRSQHNVSQATNFETSA